MADKVYTIVMQVDLNCPLCYKKIKKTLSRYRERYQIQKEVFDEKQNTVTISGLFCPNKLSKKLCYTASESIKGIKILEKNPSEPSKLKPSNPDPPPPTAAADPPKKVTFVVPLLESDPPKLKPVPAPKEPDPKPIKTPESTPAVPELAYPPVQPIGVRYEGYGWGPYHQGYGWPPPYYDGYDRPQRGYDGYGRQRYISPCWQYFSEEDPNSCTIM
ncbi:protein PYRICULARIA ORYZAE RESISTANCE 21-like [Telopea speciosissima]|uniref:protein PYRICULARIA ORYZAE RESISTANCE 21-like n=1 Tax=Telopea speciosissima TaxID=54955 RepID=UPI001CC71DB4|nr:protein PYRICULARIA ORYZAE RESISTANCE 21-like [Telopea speciosissima]